MNRNSHRETRDFTIWPARPLEPAHSSTPSDNSKNSPNFATLSPSQPPFLSLQLNFSL